MFQPFFPPVILERDVSKGTGRKKQQRAFQTITAWAGWAFSVVFILPFFLHSSWKKNLWLTQATCWYINDLFIGCYSWTDSTHEALPFVLSPRSLRRLQIVITLWFHWLLTVQSARIRSLLGNQSFHLLVSKTCLYSSHPVKQRVCLGSFTDDMTAEGPVFRCSGKTGIPKFCSS